MVRNRGVMAGAALIVIVSVLAGCSEEDRPETVKVFGKVTYEGQPVTDGTVTFHSVGVTEGDPNRPALGVLKPDGTYVLSTYRQGDGALPGEYQVAVVSVQEQVSVEQFAAGAKPKAAIPSKYSVPGTSGLTATVSTDAKDSVEVNFDLTGETEEGP